MGTNAPRFRVVECDAWITDCVSRLPFRFGIVTMRAAPLCLMRVVAEFENGGGAERVAGFSSDLLVPKWFEKDPGRSLEESWACLTEGIGAACAEAVASGQADSAFGHWRRVYGARVESWAGDRAWKLLLGQGVSLVERAMIDGICRAGGTPFHVAARSGALGFEGEPFGLGPTDLGEVVRESPLDRVALRHTVGLVDALDERPAGAVDDGLPVTLAEAIDEQGLTHLKIKVGGDVEADLDRLVAIAGVVRARMGTPPVCTLDGNEQFASIAQFGELLAKAREDERAAWLLERMAWIEQPLARARTFDADANAGLADLGVPVIIDEADADADALPDGAALGYRGVSVKNCKGAFRALASAVRCKRDGLFQSSEDLTNLGAIALQQDLTLASSLGLAHAERNGHHYFAGLGHLPEAERDHLKDHHADLYGLQAKALAIAGGSIALGSVHAAPGFGYAGPVDLAERTPLEEWTPQRILRSYAD